MLIDPVFHEPRTSGWETYRKMRGGVVYFVDTSARAWCDWDTDSGPGAFAVAVHNAVRDRRHSFRLVCTLPCIVPRDMVQ